MPRCDPALDGLCHCLATPQGLACSCAAGAVDPVTLRCPACVYDGSEAPTRRCNADPTEVNPLGGCTSNGSLGGPGQCQCIAGAQLEASGRCSDVLLNPPLPRRRRDQLPVRAA